MTITLGAISEIFIIIIIIIIKYYKSQADMPLRFVPACVVVLGWSVLLFFV